MKQCLTSCLSRAKRSVTSVVQRRTDRRSVGRSTVRITWRNTPPPNFNMWCELPRQFIMRSSTLLLLLFITAASTFSIISDTAFCVKTKPVLGFARARVHANAEEDSADKQAQLNESDLDSADSGPKILMPPEEMLGVMPSEADSFGGYLLPYAGLVLLALALASAAFATLVLAG